MNLEKFQAAIKGQKTIIMSHWTGGSLKDNKVMKTRQIEVSDVRILPTTKLIGYTFYSKAGACIDVLIRVADVVEVKPVCSLEECEV